MVIKICQPRFDTTLGLGSCCWVQALGLPQNLNQMAKPEGAVWEFTVGHRSGPLAIQPLNVAIDDGIAEISEGDLLCPEPGSKTVGCPQM